MAESWEEPDPQEKMADAIKQQSNTMRELFLGMAGHRIDHLVSFPDPPGTRTEGARDR